MAETNPASTEALAVRLEGLASKLEGGLDTWPAVRQSYPRIGHSDLTEVDLALAADLRALLAEREAMRPWFGKMPTEYTVYGSGEFSVCGSWKDIATVRRWEFDAAERLPTALDRLTAAESRATAAEARVAELEGVLKELTAACEADFIGGTDMSDEPDDEAVGGGLDGDMAITFGMLRRARAALQTEGRGDV